MQTGFCKKKKKNLTMQHASEISVLTYYSFHPRPEYGYINISKAACRKALLKYSSKQSN